MTSSEVAENDLLRDMELFAQGRHSPSASVGSASSCMDFLDMLDSDAPAHGVPAVPGMVSTALLSADSRCTVLHGTDFHAPATACHGPAVLFSTALLQGICEKQGYANLIKGIRVNGTADDCMNAALVFLVSPTVKIMVYKNGQPVQYEPYVSPVLRSYLTTQRPFFGTPANRTYILGERTTAHWSSWVTHEVQSTAEKASARSEASATAVQKTPVKVHVGNGNSAGDTRHLFDRLSYSRTSTTSKGAPPPGND